MSNIQIDFDYLKKARDANLSTDDAIELYLIYQKEYKLFEVWANLPFITPAWLAGHFKPLEEKGFIKIIGTNLPEDLEFRQEFLNLVTPNNSKINFDEFWDVFPTATRSGRSLRAENKVFHGKPTRDYEVCKQKYLSKVKDEELHKEIVAIIKKRVELNQYEYINGIEVYINQRKWEQDIALLRKKGITSIHKMI